MSYNRKELKVTERKQDRSNPYKMDMIYDPRGQWAHPGQNTRIPGSDITMQGVPYPVMGVPNMGTPMMMMPGQNYSFPGADYVDEYPMMQTGGEFEYEDAIYYPKNFTDWFNENNIPAADRGGYDDDTVAWNKWVSDNPPGSQFNLGEGITYGEWRAAVGLPPLEGRCTEEDCPEKQRGGIVNMQQGGSPAAERPNITPKPRQGVRKNPDGTESSHLMRREYVDGIGWVVFPSLFQDDDGTWIDMGKEYGDDWRPIYEEAKRRGEVYEFGEDLDSAVKFGDKGSWKQQGGQPLYVDSKSDPRYKAYQDSLNLYNYYKTQKGMVGSKPWYKNTINWDEPEGSIADRDDDWEQGQEVYGRELKRLQEKVSKQPYLMYDPEFIKKYKQTEEFLAYPVSWHQADSDIKLWGIGDKLIKGDPNYFWTNPAESPDLAHKNIKPVGTYAEDNRGGAGNMRYKKPVQPVKVGKQPPAPKTEPVKPIVEQLVFDHATISEEDYMPLVENVMRDAAAENLTEEETQQRLAELQEQYGIIVNKVTASQEMMDSLGGRGTTTTTTTDTQETETETETTGPKEGQVEVPGWKQVWISDDTRPGGGYWKKVYSPTYEDVSAPEYQKGGRTPIYVDDPKDLRLHNYLDSLNLWKAHQKQLKLNPEGAEGFVAPRNKENLGMFYQGSIGLDPNTYYYKDIEDFRRYEKGRDDLDKKYGLDQISIMDDAYDVQWKKLKQDPLFKKYYPQMDAATDMETFSHPEFEARPEDVQLAKYYDKLTFYNPAVTGYWSTPDLGHSTIMPTEQYLGMAWNPVYKKPVQPYKYTGDYKDVHAYRDKPLVAGSGRKWKGAGDASGVSTRTTPDPKRSVVDNLNMMGEDSSFSHRKELFKEAGLEGEYKGTAKQNQALNEWLTAGRPVQGEEPVKEAPAADKPIKTSDPVIKVDTVPVDESPVGKTPGPKPGQIEVPGWKQEWIQDDTRPGGGYWKKVYSPTYKDVSSPEYQSGGGVGRSATRTTAALGQPERRGEILSAKMPAPVTITPGDPESYMQYSKEDVKGLMPDAPFGDIKMFPEFHLRQAEKAWMDSDKMREWRDYMHQPVTMIGEGNVPLKYFNDPNSRHYDPETYNQTIQNRAKERDEYKNWWIHNQAIPNWQAEVDVRADKVLENYHEDRLKYDPNFRKNLTNFLSSNGLTGLVDENEIMRHDLWKPYVDTSMSTAERNQFLETLSDEEKFAYFNSSFNQGPSDAARFRQSFMNMFTDDYEDIGMTAEEAKEQDWTGLLTPLNIPGNYAQAIFDSDYSLSDAASGAGKDPTRMNVMDEMGYDVLTMPIAGPEVLGAKLLGKLGKYGIKGYKGLQKFLGPKFKEAYDLGLQKLVDPVIYNKTYKELKNLHRSWETKFGTEEANQRLINLGIKPEELDMPALTFSREGSYYSPQTHNINIDPRQVKELDFADPKSVYEHELGHFLQRERFKNTDVFKDWIKQYEKEIKDWNEFMKDPDKYAQEVGMSKIIKDNYLENPEMFMPRRPLPGIHPTPIDHLLRKMDINPKVLKRLEDWKANPRYTDEVVKDLAYFRKGSQGSEPFPFFREFREGMVRDGIIDDIYDKVTNEDVLKYISSNPKDRLGNLVAPTEKSLTILREVINRMPAVAGVAGTSAYLSQQQTGGQQNINTMSLNPFYEKLRLGGMPNYGGGGMMYPAYGYGGYKYQTGGPAESYFDRRRAEAYQGRKPEGYTAPKRTTREAEEQKAKRTGYMRQGFNRQMGGGNNYVAPPAMMPEQTAAVQDIMTMPIVGTMTRDTGSHKVGSGRGFFDSFKASRAHNQRARDLNQIMGYEAVEMTRPRDFRRNYGPAVFQQGGGADINMLDSFLRSEYGAGPIHDFIQSQGYTADQINNYAAMNYGINPRLSDYDLQFNSTFDSYPGTGYWSEMMRVINPEVENYYNTQMPAEGWKDYGPNRTNPTPPKGAYGGNMYKQQGGDTLYYGNLYHPDLLAYEDSLFDFQNSQAAFQNELDYMANKYPGYNVTKEPGGKWQITADTGSGTATATGMIKPRPVVPRAWDRDNSRVQVDRQQGGGMYEDMDLTDAQIAELRRQGYRVEEL